MERLHRLASTLYVFNALFHVDPGIVAGSRKCSAELRRTVSDHYSSDNTSWQPSGNGPHNVIHRSAILPGHNISAPLPSPPVGNQLSDPRVGGGRSSGRHHSNAICSVCLCK